LASILPFDMSVRPTGNILESTVNHLMKVDKVLDIRGWGSPWSILKAKSELNLMEPGQTLEVLISDQDDFLAVFRRSNHRLIATEDEVGFSRLYVRRGPTGKDGSTTSLSYTNRENSKHTGGRNDNRKP
jgi:TusA-related sulfurtransferase